MDTQFRQLGSALIHDGMDVEDITALAVIVEHYEAALKWLVNRNGGETSGMIAGISACSAPGSLDTSLSHAAGLIEIAACHA